ncbi:unnamed protein product [Mesocestoides corti]|uniref:Kinesin motor domain-containing protein n=1 Tax=Mesocestoides corti TaxID=53468 RepID=A0A0R3ULY5_MESCO|nr:unnamed protein product [Mesocestoides corti]
MQRLSNDTFFEISFFEIYNEHIRDLLAAPVEGCDDRSGLRVREHPHNGPYVENLTKHAVSDLEELRRFIDRGMAARATAATNENAQSSRSHSIFTIYVNQNVRNDAGGIQSIQSKLHLIDLAGSSPASLNKLPATSSTRRCRFVPYRDSKLTWLLRDSLGGNAKTTVIITVSPSIRHIRETVNALRFSQRIKLIRNRPTSIKDLSSPYISHLLDEINRLKSEVNEWRQMHPRHKGLGMQLLRHQGLQTSCDDIVHHYNHQSITISSSTTTTSTTTIIITTTTTSSTINSTISTSIITTTSTTSSIAITITAPSTTTSTTTIITTTTTPTTSTTTSSIFNSTTSISILTTASTTSSITITITTPSTTTSTNTSSTINSTTSTSIITTPSTISTTTPTTSTTASTTTSTFATYITTTITTTSTPQPEAPPPTP